jgi:hypothetical protein
MGRIGQRVRYVRDTLYAHMERAERADSTHGIKKTGSEQA